MNQKQANDLARKLLPGWREYRLGDPDWQEIAFHPSDGDTHNIASVVNTSPDWDGGNEEQLREACAEAKRLYNQRMADKRDAALEHQKEVNTGAAQPTTAGKPTDDWSFTASASNPPHLGRILREAREHGVRLLRVRCGEAGRVFVERTLFHTAVTEFIPGTPPNVRGMTYVSENDPGVIERTYVVAMGTPAPHAQLSWCLLQCSSTDEHRIVFACRAQLQKQQDAAQAAKQNRREVKVEVLG